MGKASVEIRVPGPISAAEEVWYDTSRWPVWIDGFGHMFSIEGDWPKPGAIVIWDAPPHGRGRVLEEVTGYEARVGQTVAVEDEKLRGIQSVAFSASGDEVIVRLGVEWQLKEGGPLAPLTDFFFIRRAMRDSLSRTLARFAREVVADRELAQDS